jgi:hypothetical protein
LNSYQKPNHLKVRNPAYRRAFERLDEALEKNTPSNNYEKIRLMRLALFGDVEKLEQSGRVVIPK